MAPRVTFLVPCYKLGHLVGECVSSMLAQTYEDFEILVLDDCSPDSTPEVARSFADPRVRHVRHTSNLGHLRNYNAGIAMAQGEFIWLVSADDKLRRPYVLDRFVRAMDEHPSAAYVFCPAIKFDERGERYEYGSIGGGDRLVPGLTFVETLLDGNIVCAPTGMARRSAYDAAGHFPLDLPFAGDWYLWAAFAFHGDVVFLSEAMVNYRDHAMNMTKSFLERRSALVRDDLNVRWRIKGLAQAGGHMGLVDYAVGALASQYASLVARAVTANPPDGLTVDAFEASLGGRAAADRESARIRAVAYAALGDAYVAIKRPEAAREAYARALGADPTALRTRIKAVLAQMGRPGLRVRSLLEQLTGRAA